MDFDEIFPLDRPNHGDRRGRLENHCGPITNLVFQDELQDTAAQLGAYTGVSPPASNEELRNRVIRKARNYDIELDPKHVIVRRSGKREYPVIFIAVDHTVNVNLLVYSYDVHFYPTSRGGKF